MAKKSKGTGDNPLKMAKALTEEVNNAWEDGSLYEKVSPITQDLLRYWFFPAFCDIREINFHEGQKQAILNVIYLHEVLGIKNVKDLYFFNNRIDLKNAINKNLSKISSSIFSYLICKEDNNEFLELNKVCKFIKGKKPNEISEKYENDFLNYLTIEVLSNQNQVYAYDEKGIKVNEYDILMVMAGASSGKLFYGKTGLVGSTLSKVEVKEDYLELIYQFLKLNEKFISDNTTGSAIPHVDKSLVLNLKCPISKELLNYSTVFKNMRASIIENNKEILKLQKLRDTLLPKLMSGELDVSEVNCEFGCLV